MQLRNRNNYFRYELMDPIVGMITNDSYLLNKNYTYDSYNLTDGLILTPLETRLNGENVVILHIKISM